MSVQPSSRAEGASAAVPVETFPAEEAISLAPDGTVYSVPAEDEAQAAFAQIARSARREQAQGRRVVVVQGLGFVGAAVAAVIATATDEQGRPLYFVIGVDLPTPASFWKVGKIRAGVPPIDSIDAQLAGLMHKAVHDYRNLHATTCEEAYELADVIIVDVQLDATPPPIRGGEISVELEGFVAAVRTIGRRMQPDALVLVETTVPVGTCESIVLPALREERRARGINSPPRVAHAYERVMPGAQYVNSIRAYPRVFSGIDQASSQAARAFLSTYVQPANGRNPLWELDSPTDSELAKLLENSYRATNIAFIHEWTLLAESIGINLFAVIDAIKVREGTHDNMRYPGFGVGGYCLTKDSLLAQWGATNLLGSDVLLSMSLDALRTNAQMPLHTARLVAEASRGDLELTLAVCGISYLADVADTRESPSEVLIDHLLEHGTTVRLHDPIVEAWPARPDLVVSPELDEALHGVDGIVFAVRHPQYRGLSAAKLIQSVGRPGFVVDAQNVVSDSAAEELHAAGWRVFGVGKGHWRKRLFHLPLD
jgi:UDP-N-acetyl-D-glucosamine dehydrogenase